MVRGRPDDTELAVLVAALTARRRPEADAAARPVRAARWERAAPRRAGGGLAASCPPAWPGGVLAVPTI
ncbi:acyl-CoA carboxylase epsilon subunit [Kitasatospora sp. NA04385]|uniref:acyl-CoA carboxylase epsilon subunit n=1 Tax=Kitasatospora sp. NA04385 TaxID=2742135 RepID=UPI0034CEFD2A